METTESQKLFEQITALFTEFERAHNSTKKVDKAKARKAIGSIKKLVTDYNKASVAENK